MLVLELPGNKVLYFYGPSFILLSLIFCIFLCYTGTSRQHPYLSRIYIHEFDSQHSYSPLHFLWHVVQLNCSNYDIHRIQKSKGAPLGFKINILWKKNSNILRRRTETLTSKKNWESKLTCLNLKFVCNSTSKSINVCYNHSFIHLSFPLL